jgi:hypothetical protein
MYIRYNLQPIRLPKVQLTPNKNPQKHNNKQIIKNSLNLTLNKIKINLIFILKTIIDKLYNLIPYNLITKT